MGNRTTDAVAGWKKTYESEPDSFLIQIIYTKVSHADQHIAAQAILEDRKRDRQEQQHLQQIAAISELDQKVDDISGRLRKSEWKTWTLRFAFLGVLLMTATIVRDYFDWTLQPPSTQEPAPAAQEPVFEKTIAPEEPDALPKESMKPALSKTEEIEPPETPREQDEDADPDPDSIL